MSKHVHENVQSIINRLSRIEGHIRGIKKMVEELKLNHWTFTYIGTDHDVEKFAMNISITNTMTFQRDEAGMKNMFLKEKSARANFSRRIMDMKDTKDNFYGDDEDIK